MEPLLEARGITKRFGAVVALDQVDFQVGSGEVVALLGENGAGKSTLAKILSGALSPDGGSLLYRGRPVTWADPLTARRQGVVAVHQEPTLIPSFSVAENVLLAMEPLRGGFGRRLGLVDPSQVVQQAASMLSILGVQEPTGVPVMHLPLARQQLVEVARALCVQPRVLILDEATTRLMPSDVVRLFEVVRSLTRAGAGVVFISHRLEEVLEVADRVYVLKDGRKSGQLTRQQATRERLIQMMVGRDLPTVFPERPRSAAHQGQPILQAKQVGYEHRLLDISLDLFPGEVLGIGGLEGHGQRELIRGLGGLQPFTTGEVWVEGQRHAPRSPRDAIRLGVAYLPEDRRLEGLLMPVSVAENTLLPEMARRLVGLLSLRRDLSMANGVLSRLGVRTPGLDAPVSALSGGNQQKVLFAKWLRMQPKVLLLHEPTRGVDVQTRMELYRLICGAAAAGAGVILVTSDMMELLNLSTRIVVLYEGRISGTLCTPGEFTEERVMSLAVGEGPAVA